MNAGATSAGVDVTAYVQLSPSDVLDQDPLVAGTDVGVSLMYRCFPWDDTAMAIGAEDPYDAAQDLSFSAFGYSTASPLATTRLTPAYLRQHSSLGAWTDTSAVGVGTVFTKLDDGAYNTGMGVGTTYDDLQPDSANAASGQLLFSTSTWSGTCGADRDTANTEG